MNCFEIIDRGNTRDICKSKNPKSKDIIIRGKVPSVLIKDGGVKSSKTRPKNPRVPRNNPPKKPSRPKRRKK